MKLESLPDEVLASLEVRIGMGGLGIGPDPQNPPDEGEISRGGDSGAAWIFKNAKG